MKDKITLISTTIKAASEMVMSKELVCMKRVMRRLDLAEKNDVPKMKGKVAGSISASDELLVSILTLHSIFGSH